MNADLQQALAAYERIGWGGELPRDDRETVRDFLIKTLSHTDGITLTDAVKLVHMIEGGSWSEGWERGYDSGRNHATPRFVLNGGQS